MVFQSYALWPHLSVRQNVAFGLEEKRLPRDQVREGVARALQLVGLADLADRKPGQISGGQQQRVALARTLAMEPRVLLLDEPLSNLDAKLRHHMRLELVSLQRRLGITTIFVTHDQEEALTTADRLAVMDGGVLQLVGSPMALFDAPASRFVAEFIGSINLVRGTLRRESPDRARFRCGAGEIVLPLTEETAPDAERGVQHMGQPMAQHTEQNTAKPAAEHGAQGASGDKGERIAEGTEERNAQRTQERTLAFRPHSLALRRQIGRAHV